MARKATPLGTPSAAKPEVAKQVGGFRLPPSAQPAATYEVNINTVRCPTCGGAMWDNRENKRNPRAPDFKCKDRTCEGIIWPRRGVVYVDAPNEATTWALDDSEVEADAPGTNWAILTSADGSCALALGTTKQSRKDDALAHWGIAWTKKHAKFAVEMHGDEKGCWCRVCQRNNCAGAKRARKALMEFELPL